MEFAGLNADFDALNAYDQHLEGLEHGLDGIGLGYFVVLGTISYFIWQQEHLWIPSQDTTFLRYWRVTSQEAHYRNLM